MQLRYQLWFRTGLFGPVSAEFGYRSCMGAFGTPYNWAVTVSSTGSASFKAPSMAL